ncbi:Uncharacterized protein ALO83_00997 [Pseudomonas cannabina pv. alisalensis]|uniref:DUF2591 domain-containing protein n=3 Tax=Pseudomonas syringae group TaxID=136849 RepID=A0A8T8BZJ2_PSEYM|nr:MULTISPECIES: phage protein NinX family protein [Pseudomonas syringae group]KPW25779.1 Uncharacterized protein ALO83_00997 [Pseudomonas cannabina pv. alisalensis]MBM0140183.1 DUF2591 family protein [Pseudomonas cannabina pv. alisalensis]QHE96840.1 DUF2591 domain-containing protein [Pseudomonas syringae pv. maculicola str. ES4326]RMN77550.1 hypothetical protein ALQ52_103952 [Pseudomonas cannabina pv. alisalensis]RMN97969.1 hypothetical protein ALQ51_04332 [Pseudomonas cannabina]
MTEFAEVKTADLLGAALDWAVAIAEGWESDRPQDGQLKMPWLSIDLRVVAGADRMVHPANRFNPSTDWSQGGPLIEKYRIDFAQYADQVEAFSQIRSPGSKGGTYLIAACRAIVASVLGETVSVPKELLL